MQTSCAADSKLVTGGVKYESRRGCSVGVPDPRPCSSGRTFSRCSVKLVLGELLVNCSLQNFISGVPLFCHLLTKIYSTFTQGFLDCLEYKSLSRWHRDCPFFTAHFPPVHSVLGPNQYTTIISRYWPIADTSVLAYTSFDKC